MTTNHFLLSDCENPALYVSTYAKYNNGYLKGAWVDLTSFDSYDDFINFCLDLHQDESDPELMFQDYMYFPDIWYSESCFDEDTFDNIIYFANHSNRSALEAFINYFGTEYLYKFDDYFCGEWNSEEDFAYDLISECYDIDKALGSLSSYFNYNAFCRDLFTYDYYFNNGFVFRR